MTSRSEIMLRVAVAIVESGYADFPRRACIKRTRKDAQYRIEQLTEARDTYIAIHGYAPTRETLADMVGMSESSVCKIMKYGVNR